MNAFQLPEGVPCYPNEPAWEPPAPRLVRSQRLWLPGHFPSNNDMLGYARSDGFAAGLHHYERHHRRKRPSTQLSGTHARIVKAIRHQAAVLAIRELEPVPPERWVRLAFSLMGHARYDSDAWYLAAKAATDGLQDAGIIGRDGTGVHSTEGRNVKSVEEAVALLYAPGTWRGDPPQGLLIEVQPWG